MTEYVIKSEGYAKGIPGGATGQFLAWFDPTKDGPGGEEMGGWTSDPAEAKTFTNIWEAREFWRQPMIGKDGKPVGRASGDLERPLTAFHISVVPLDMAQRTPTIAIASSTERGLLDAIRDHKGPWGEGDDDADSHA